MNQSTRPRLDTSSPGFGDHLKSLALMPLPQHLLSRGVYWLTRQSSSLTTPAIRAFVRAFDVDMSEAAEPDISHYATFNAFFTRALKPGARPIMGDANTPVSAADGTLSAAGDIENGQLLQAKGIDYSLKTLLGGAEGVETPYRHGSFATIYLSPRDYHRLHMPLGGQLLSQTHVPGRLFSVAPHTVRALPGLFTRNERVIAEFDTAMGRMALVLVGAVNVAAIETVWHGQITPPAGKQISREHYEGDAALTLEQGAEMGRFNMGSTIIMVFERRIRWNDDLDNGSTLRMGEALGQFVSD